MLHCAAPAVWTSSVQYNTNLFEECAILVTAQLFPAEKEIRELMAKKPGCVCVWVLTLFFWSQGNEVSLAHLHWECRRPEDMRSCHFFPPHAKCMIQTMPHCICRSCLVRRSRVFSHQKELKSPLLWCTDCKEKSTNTLFIANCSFGLAPYPWWLPGTQICL